jgi:Cation transport ATPase
MEHQHHNHTHENHSHGHDHHNHDHHSGQHQSHGDHHGHHEHMIEDFKKRFWISLIITLPIIVLAPMIQELLGYQLRFNGDRYVQFILSSVIFFYGGWPFLKGLAEEIKRKLRE